MDSPVATGLRSETIQRAKEPPRKRNVTIGLRSAIARRSLLYDMAAVRRVAD